MHFVVHSVLMAHPGKKQLFRFGALKLEGISTCGCYLVKQAFVFFFWVVRLLGAHHTVR